MNKITCEVCGTTYQEGAGSCPICGWINKGAAPEEELDLDGIRQDYLDGPVKDVGSAADRSAQEKKSRSIFDYDAVNTGKKPPVQPVQKKEEVYEDGFEEEEEEQPRTNVLLVVILVVLIVGLLLTTGYMFVRFFLPGRNTPTETEAPSTAAEIVEAQTEAPTQTEEPTIPCTDLAVPNGIDVLNAAGQNWLLHVVVLPEDTTDTVVYTSENEAIATVNEEGRVTAVAEGETNIVITCGDKTVTCPVKVQFVAATEPTVLETVTAETGADEEEPEETKSDVVVKLKKHDITLGRLGIYYDLELDCDLDPEDVEWVTNNSFVATVRNGRVTVTGKGVTTITAKYGGHEDTCVVRCIF